MIDLEMAKIFNFYLTIEEKVSSRSLSFKKIHKRQNYRKGRYSLAHQVKIEVTGPKKVIF